MADTNKQFERLSNAIGLDKAKRLGELSDQFFANPGGSGISPTQMASGLTQGGFDPSNVINDFGIQMNNAIRGGLGELFRLAGDEDADREKAIGIAQREFDQSNQNFQSIQRRINRNLFSEHQDASADASRGAVGNLRRSIGARGVGFNSGVAFDRRRFIEEQRASAGDASRRGIANDFAGRLQNESHNRFIRSLGLADRVQSPRSMHRADGLAFLTKTRGEQQNQLIAMQEASRTRSAARRAGIQQGIGGALGLGFNALTGGVA